MTQFLPPNLLALFAPRDPIPFLPPVDQLPYEKNTAGYSGIADFISEFEDPSLTPEPYKIETKEERQERKRRAKTEATAYKLEQDIALWSPTNNPMATTDPYRTLFVARVNYDTTESKLRREFEIYGSIKKIVIVYNKDAKPRGYAFIEYEHERDMHSAYKHADGKKIDGRRVLVDVERGRTVKGWLPRRLGGGLGGTRRGGPDVNLKHSGREEPSSRPADHYMGGGGGGGGKDRAMDRDRERPERRRSRSRSRERRRRSRSRSRERHRGERHKRDRSRDRERGRDRDAAPAADKGDASLDVSGAATSEAEPPRKERRRSRSRDKERRRRRSRSRDRKRRDHDRDRERDRDRNREGRRDRGAERVETEPDVPRIKEEPLDPEEPVEDNFNKDGYEEEYNYNNNGETNTYDDGY